VDARPLFTEGFSIRRLRSAAQFRGQFDDAWHYIENVIVAVETTKERWFEAEIHRIGWEIARMAPDLNAAKAEAYFKHAVAVAKVTDSQKRFTKHRSYAARRSDLTSSPFVPEIVLWPWPANL